MGAADRPRRATRRGTERPDPGGSSVARRHARSRRAAARAWSRARAVAFPSPADRAGVSEDVVNSRRRVTFSCPRRRNASPHHARIASDLVPLPDTKKRASLLSRVSHEQVEEFYVLTWESPKEMIFEMPVRVSSRAQKGFSVGRVVDSTAVDRSAFPFGFFNERGGRERRHASTSVVVRDDRGFVAVTRERLDRSSDASRVSRASWSAFKFFPRREPRTRLLTSPPSLSPPHLTL